MTYSDASDRDRQLLEPAGSSRIPAMIVVVLGIVAVVGAAIWLVCAATRNGLAGRTAGSVRLLGVDRQFPTNGRFPGDPYVGSSACAGCHPGEAASHSRSGHASTLVPAGRRSVSRQLDGTSVIDPERPDVLWSYQFREGKLQIERTAGPSEKWVADYAFGSGHHATTFVSLLDPSRPSVLEHRMTYYAPEKALGITPGQNADVAAPEVKPHGHELKPRDALKCFRCHTTQLSARGDAAIDEETMIPNVSCERCHGPGRAHVLNARRGASELALSLPFGPGRWSAETLSKLCGDCHRHPSGARPGQIDRRNRLLARFQPVGLMQSKCYLRSEGALSCVTCHDPHERVASDRASYDRTCLGCHGGSLSTTEPGIRVSAAAVVCTVSPRARCVECHMPRVDAGQHVLYSDHWIRIRGKDESAAAIPSPVPDLGVSDSGRP